MHGYSWRTKEEFRSSSAGVTGRCDLLGTEPGPLQVFLTTEPPAIYCCVIVVWFCFRVFFLPLAWLELLQDMLYFEAIVKGCCSVISF